MLVSATQKYCVGGLPNAREFALQWYIGYRVLCESNKSLMRYI